MNKYFEVVCLFLGKNVKEVKWYERVYDFRVMDLISVEEVV